MAAEHTAGPTPAGPRPVRAPRGTALSCKGWPQEAAMRMLMNNLDPEVAEHPDQLIVYGGSGRAARSWSAYDAIVASLQGLADDETLLVQSGKPVGIVGTQGILQGTYETFAAVAAKRFGGTLAGTITLTAGLGGMGGAQPLAVTMNDGVAICVDCDETRIDRRIEHRYLDVKAADIDDALRLAVEARDAKRPLSIGLLGNAAEVLPAMLSRNAPIDIVTDQTSAHDPLSYLPIGIEL